MPIGDEFQINSYTPGRQLSEVLEPQSAEDRKELLRGFDTVFPEDYLEALAQVGGFHS